MASLSIQAPTTIPASNISDHDFFSLPLEDPPGDSTGAIEDDPPGRGVEPREVVQTPGDTSEGVQGDGSMELAAEGDGKLDVEDGSTAGSISENVVEGGRDPGRVGGVGDGGSQEAFENFSYLSDHDRGHGPPREELGMGTSRDPSFPDASDPDSITATLTIASTTTTVATVGIDGDNESPSTLPSPQRLSLSLSPCTASSSGHGSMSTSSEDLNLPGPSQQDHHDRHDGRDPPRHESRNQSISQELFANFDITASASASSSHQGKHLPTLRFGDSLNTIPRPSSDSDISPLSQPIRIPGTDEVSQSHLPTTTTSGRLSSDFGDSGEGTTELDQEDLDSHPIYVLLSSSTSPTLRSAWDAAQIILLPPISTLPLAIRRLLAPPSTSNISLLSLAESMGYTEEDLDDDNTLVQWIAAHAFRPSSLFKGRWTGCGQVVPGEKVHASVDMSSGVVRINRGNEPAPSPTSECGADAVPFPLQSPVQHTLTAHLTAPLLQTQLQVGSAVPSRQLKVTGEMTVYRRAKGDSIELAANPNVPHVPPPNPASSHRQPKSKLRSVFKAPKWMRSQSSSKDKEKHVEHDKSSSTSNVVKQVAVLERLRVVSVDGTVVEWKGEDSRSTTRFASAVMTREPSQVGSTPEGYPFPPISKSFVTAPPQRSFLNDVVFLLRPGPSCGSQDAAHLSDGLRHVLDLTREFSSTFVYLAGFDAYNVKRIRSGITGQVRARLGKSIDFVPDDPKGLSGVIDNVTMGFLHSKLYTSSVVPLFETDDARFERLMSIYRRRSSLLLDFCPSLAIPLILDKEIEMLARLRGRAPDPEQEHAKSVLEDSLKSSLDDDDFLATCLEAVTPLDSIGIVTDALSSVIAAIDSESVRSPGGPSRSSAETDDLIPILAFLVVRADLPCILSIVHYITAYQLDTAPSGQSQWALATFESAVAYLKSDPLQLGAPDSSPLISIADGLSPRVRRSSTRTIASTSLSTSPLVRRTSRAHSLSSKPLTAAQLVKQRALTRESYSVPDSRRNSFQSSRSVDRASALSDSGDSIPPAGDDRMSIATSPRLRQLVLEEPSLPPLGPTHSRSSSQRRRNRLSLDTNMLMNAASVLDEAGYTGSGSVDDFSSDSSSRRRTASLHSLASPADELEIRPQIILRSSAASAKPSARTPTRSFHLSSENTATAATTSISRSRSQANEKNPEDPQSMASALQMRRTGSEGASAPATAPWSSNPTLGAWSNASTAPRTAPSSNLTPAEGSLRAVRLERSSTVSTLADAEADSASWWSWGRRRLSTTTSSSSLANYVAALETTSSVDTSDDASTVDSATIPRARKNSEAAADVLNARRETAAETATDPPEKALEELVNNYDRQRRSSTNVTFPSRPPRARPPSGVSVSSAPASDLDHGDQPSTPSSSFRRRGRLELLHPSASTVALPPRIDTSSVMSLPWTPSNSTWSVAEGSAAATTSLGHARYSSLPSPIKELPGPLL